jgi:hypothetical protein
MYSKRQTAEGRREKLDGSWFQYLARVKSCLGDCYKCRRSLWPENFIFTPTIYLTLSALKVRRFLVPRHTLQLPILAAIFKPNTRSIEPSVEPNLDNPRGLVSLSVRVLTESVWYIRFLSFPMFRRDPPYIVLVWRLRITALFWYRHWLESMRF